MKELFWNLIDPGFWKRVVQGKFWFPVRSGKPLKGLVLDADKYALPRGVRGWKEQWKWVILEPDMRGVLWANQVLLQSYITSSGLDIRFSAGGKIMRYMSPISEEYIAVRVGDGDVVFSAAIKGRDDVVPLRVVCGPASRDRIFNVLRAIDSEVNANDIAWI